MAFVGLLQKRNLGFPLTVGALVIVSLWFYYRQNFAGQIGGAMSMAKLLWLDYALVAWFIVPFFVARSADVASSLRRIYAVHLANFTCRGAIEIWMLYVTVSWSPRYGITHDLCSLALLSMLLWRKAPVVGGRRAPLDGAARHFLVSIRLGLVCEVVFAWLFYRAIGGEVGIYFASDDAHFTFINRLTLVIVLIAYTDLGIFLWRARRIFFPIAIATPDQDNHAYEVPSV